MKYSEYINQGGKGIITLLCENQTLKFLLSDIIKPLDDTFLMENGNKNFTISVENMLATSNDLTPVASMLKIKYAKYWKVLYNSQPKDTDPIYTSITIGNSDLNTTGTTMNTVSGYDSDTMVNSDGSNTTGNTTNTNSVKTLNYDDLTNLLSELKNNVFYDKLFTDIRNYIFNTFYGNERE